MPKTTASPKVRVIMVTKCGLGVIVFDVFRHVGEGDEEVKKYCPEFLNMHTTIIIF